MTIAIDRAFVRTSASLIHYRAAGDDTTLPPVVLLHGGPGSSAGLAPMIAALAAERRVIAPDTPGCGDSEPLHDDEPTIPRYAEVLGEVLDRLAVPRVDLYGHHTGAQIACELAIAEPHRVRRAVLDGVALFPHALRREFLARYAPPIALADDGSHLLWLWEFVRELTQHFPHYSRDEAHRVIPATVLPPTTVMGIVSDILKAWPTWHRAYRAAFRHDLSTRLPLVTISALILRVAGDALARYAGEAAELLPHALLRDTTREQRLLEISGFLRGGF